jgi:hypothetical protein
VAEESLFSTSLRQQLAPVGFDPLLDLTSRLEGEGKSGFSLQVRYRAAHFVGTLVAFLSERVDSLYEFLAGINRELEGLYRVVVLVSAARPCSQPQPAPPWPMR